MRDSDFQDRTTGELVRTVFVERTQDGSSQTINGLAFVPRPLPPGLDPVTLTGKLYDVLDAAKTSLLRPADAREYAKVFIAPEIIGAIRGPGED